MLFKWIIIIFPNLHNSFWTTLTSELQQNNQLFNYPQASGLNVRCGPFLRRDEYKYAVKFLLKFLYINSNWNNTLSNVESKKTPFLCFIPSVFFPQYIISCRPAPILITYNRRCLGDCWLCLYLISTMTILLLHIYNHTHICTYFLIQYSQISYKSVTVIILILYMKKLQLREFK